MLILMTNSSATVVFLLGPLIPTGFNLTSETYHTDIEVIGTLDWDPPQGSGLEAIVDYYILFFSPSPIHQLAKINLPSGPQRVILSHNVQYNINLTAVNCLGQSEPFILNIEFGKIYY